MMHLRLALSKSYNYQFLNLGTEAFLTHRVFVCPAVSYVIRINEIDYYSHSPANNTCSRLVTQNFYKISNKSFLQSFVGKIIDFQ